MEFAEPWHGPMKDSAALAKGCAAATMDVCELRKALKMTRIK